MVLSDGELRRLGPFVPADEDVPHEGALPDLYALGGWRGEYSSPDGLIVLRVDEEAYDFHIDAKPDHKSADMRAVLAMAESRGLEPLDEDECEPEILEDGTVRIYLAHFEQPAELEKPAEPTRVDYIAARKNIRRMTVGFGLAASIVTALLIPSPLQHVNVSPTADDTVVTHKGNSPAPLSPNKGALSGTEPHRSTASPSGTSEPLRSKGRVGASAHRAAAGGKAQGAHPDDNVHRLHRGQEQSDGLGKADGPGGSSPTPRPGGTSPSPRPGGEGGQGIAEFLGGVLDGLLGSK